MDTDTVMSLLPYAIGPLLALLGYDATKVWYARKVEDAARAVLAVVQVAIGLWHGTPRAPIVDDEAFARIVDGLLESASKRMRLRLSKAQIARARKAIAEQILAMQFRRLEQAGSHTEQVLKDLQKKHGI